MTTVTFEKARWQQDAEGCWLSVKVDKPKQAIEFCAQMKEKKYQADIKEYRVKRSKNANDLCWELCTQISEKLAESKTMLSKEDIYRRNIKAAGKCDFVAVVERAVPALMDAWESRGIGWFAEIVDECKIDKCKKVCLYYGSSTYDTKEMSRLIDSIIQDAESVGVRVENPAEIDLLKREWRAG